MKNFVTYYPTENPHLLSSFIEAGFKTYLLSPKILSRLGESSFEEVLLACQDLRKRNQMIVIEFDAFVREGDWDVYLNLLDDLIQLLNKNKEEDLLTRDCFLRVHDLGVFSYLKGSKKGDLFKGIELVLDHGNHNSVGLGKYEELSPSKIVLSSQLSSHKLENVLSQIEVESEILLWGKILLFYTPRNLLSYQFQKKMDKTVEAKSEESPHKGFLLRENENGTFMFYPKDLFLLPLLDQLSQMKENLSFRFDYRFLNFSEDDLRAAVSLFKEEETDDSFYKNEHSFGLFRANKTDVLFKKLKNKKTLRNQREDFVGEVIEAHQGKHLAIRLMNQSFTKKDQLLFISPQGKEVTINPRWIKKASLEEKEEAHTGDLVLIPFVKGMTVKSVIFKV